VTDAQKQFLGCIVPLACKDMQTSGILASLTIAQAILESGWGNVRPGRERNGVVWY